MSKIHVFFATACLALLLACSEKPKEAAKASGESEAAVPVEVAPVKRQTIHQVITAEGVLYPIQQTSVMPKISAPVRRFYVNRGDHVRQGQLLATLEDRDLAASTEESKSLYQQAQASYQTTTGATMADDLTKAQSDVQTARQTLEAAQKVYDSRVQLQKEGALAQKLVEDAKVTLVQAQSQAETAQRHLQILQTVGRTEQTKGAQAQVDAAKAHYQNAEAQLSYASISSPISGVVADRPINQGEMASNGSAIVSIVDISQVIARVNVPVREAAQIHLGKPATISGPGGQLTGRVTVVSPAVNPSTTTVEVWVQAKNPGEAFKPGITVQVSVDASDIRNALVVPAAALLSLEEGGDKVMVLGADSAAHEQKVEVGVREGDSVQILSGVKEGDQVITVGGLGLEDKAKVKVGAGKDADEKKGEDKKDDEKK